MPQIQAPLEERTEGDSQLFALRIITALLLAGAAWWLAGLLIPFFLAVVLAIALSSVVARLERVGVPGTLASLLCILVVAGVLAVTAGLIVVQAGRSARGVRIGEMPNNRPGKVDDGTTPGRGLGCCTVVSKSRGGGSPWDSAG